MKLMMWWADLGNFLHNITTRGWEELKSKSNSSYSKSLVSPGSYTEKMLSCNQIDTDYLAVAPLAPTPED